jgi:uncharacterized protein YdcH (DUF465 family)
MPRAAQRRGVFFARIRNRHATAGCAIPGNLGLPSPRLRAPARSNLLTQEVSMFEGQSQAEIETLMKANTEFRQLFYRHRELDRQVMDAELGVLPLDDNTLGMMKREKLVAKQRLLQMYDRAH